MRRVPPCVSIRERNLALCVSDRVRRSTRNRLAAVIRIARLYRRAVCYRPFQVWCRFRESQVEATSIGVLLLESEEPVGSRRPTDQRGKFSSFSGGQQRFFRNSAFKTNLFTNEHFLADPLAITRSQDPSPLLTAAQSGFFRNWTS